MSDRSPKNIVASIHQRLLTISRQTHRAFNDLVMYYAIERFLYRLSLSPYADRRLGQDAMRCIAAKTHLPPAAVWPTRWVFAAMRSSRLDPAYPGSAVPEDLPVLGADTGPGCPAGPRNVVPTCIRTTFAQSTVRFVSEGDESDAYDG
jgi:hypothetical protein